MLYTQLEQQNWILNVWRLYWLAIIRSWHVLQLYKESYRKIRKYRIGPKDVNHEHFKEFFTIINGGFS
jgi:hypothetical protein